MSEDKPLTLTEVLAKHGVRVRDTVSGMIFHPAPKSDEHHPLHRKPKGGKGK
jgi:hypothetical protein